MNIKQIIITSLITLAVTISSGIIVNWVTKNKINNNNSKDNLYYKILDVSEFESDSTKISLLTIEVFNDSREKYTNVEFNVGFEGNASVIDVVSKSTISKKKYIPTEKKKDEVAFQYATVFPNERIKTNIAVRNFSGTKNIQLSSAETLGKEYTSEEKKVSSVNDSFVIALLSILFLVFIFILYRFLLPLFSSFHSSLNNTAFLFLHNKQFDIANKLLVNKIEKDGASSIELSNLATTEYLMYKDFDKANSLLKMASYISNNSRSKFVLVFNEFLIYSYEKNYLVTKEKAELCIKLDYKEFKKYIEFSLIVRDIVNIDTTIKSIVEKI